MKQTALYNAHVALGAKLVDFGGWQMPLQYNGILHEHQTVRERVGIFDVSHMGRISIGGLGAEALLDYLSTNTIIGRKDGTATYTVWCSETGGTVDDLIVYRESPTEFFVVVNASNRQKDLDHLLHYSAPRDVIINDHFEEEGILAVQGPDAFPLVASLFPEASGLKPMHFITVERDGVSFVISATGYTGEKGVEIYAPHSVIVNLWKQFLEKGKKWEIEPIGLGARDTLRLEMGYALYGHELSDTITPIESVSHWTIKDGGRDFVGKKALDALAGSGKKRSQFGVVLEGKGVPREGYDVLQNGRRIGTVTSGTFSPSLQRGIAIVLVERNLKEGDSVEIAIRQVNCPAKVADLPFYTKKS